MIFGTHGCKPHKVGPQDPLGFNVDFVNSCSPEGATFSAL